MLKRYKYFVSYWHSKGNGSCYYSKPLKTQGQIDNLAQKLKALNGFGPVIITNFKELM